MLASFAAAASIARAERKVIILGVDGLDPKLLTRFMEEGRLANFRRLSEAGDFKPLTTSAPPLSPVAWSNFITGMDPGGHGIFDFVHRDPATLAPFLSISKAGDPGKSVNVGTWVLPLSGGGVELLRRGRAFWELLEERGVPTVMFRMPANFPPVETKGRALSGMGTPDMLGTPGTFSFYTDFPPRNMNEITGGVVYVVDVIDRHVAAALHGPPNSFRNLPEVGAPEMTVAFDVYLDPVEPVAKFVVGDEEFILKQGEWSDWIGVEIEALPHVVSVSAAARFYLQEVRPDFKLYVSPLQIDPLAPAMPISTPGEWSRDLAETLGRFYTQELPEDTKAYTGGIFTAHEFWEQSQFVYREQRRALDAMLDEFERGLLFFYFSSVDQGAHMLWAQMDPAHPAHERDELLIEGIATLYEQMDEALGRVMEFVDDETTLIVMSDHGFAPFEWGFNLNSWLASKGYVTFSDPERQEAYVAFQNVDWSGTRAYAVGLNGLYVNLKGRETRGVVEAADYDALLDELERELLAERNPANGEAVATRVTRTRRDLHGPEIAGGPDIIVGYNRGHRSSWESPLGEFPREILVRNLDRWSGDHAMDPAHVPGVLLTNQRITLETPALYDLTVAVLDEFGVAPLSVMLGRDCLAPPPEKP